MSDQPNDAPVTPTAIEDARGQISDLRNMLESPGWKQFTAWLRAQSGAMLEKILHPDTTSTKREWLAGAMSMHRLMNDWPQNQLRVLEHQLSTKKKEK